MSLTSVYAKAWRQQYGLPPGWLVNTEPNDPIPLGLKGQVLGDHFRRSGLLGQVAEIVVPPSEPPDHSSWQFQSSAGVHFETALEGATSGDIGWLGGAKAGITVSFDRQAGVSALGSHKWFHRYPDLDDVRSALRKAVTEGDLVEGDAVVVELQLTGKGVLVASQGGGASIVALANAEVAPGGVSIADFAGGFNATRQAGAVTMEQFGDGATIAARVIQVGFRDVVVAPARRPRAAGGE